MFFFVEFVVYCFLCECCVGVGFDGFGVLVDEGLVVVECVGFWFVIGVMIYVD